MAESLQEMDEDYEDSSEMEDEDELNQRIQKKSTDSPEQVDLEALTRSQTEPHGDLSQLQYKYKNNKSKHVIKNPSNKVQSNGKKKKNGKSSSISNKNLLKNKNKNKNGSSTNYLSKSKSMHSSVLPKKSYKQDDIEDVDVESVEDDDDFNADIMNQTITEDEVYLDMSITAEDYAKQHGTQNSKSSSNIMTKPVKKSSAWSLDNVAKGIMSAKKRLLSPEKMSATSSNGHTNGSRQSSRDSRDSPHSSSISNKHNGGMYGHSPVTPDNIDSNLSHSLSTHSNNSNDGGGGMYRKSSNNSRKDSNNSRKGSTPTSHSKKGSVSAAIFGVGKGIFAKRSGSSKDFTKSHKQSDDDEKINGNNNNHRKSPSKSNASLSSIKASLSGLKYKMGGSTKNIHNNVGSKTPTPSEEQVAFI